MFRWSVNKVKPVDRLYTRAPRDPSRHVSWHLKQDLKADSQSKVMNYVHWIFNYHVHPTRVAKNGTVGYGIIVCPL